MNIDRPLIIADDAVSFGVDVLRSGLVAFYPAGVAVGTRIPNPRPASFVRVRRAGGAIEGIVLDSALLTVDAYADTEEAASDLAGYCRAILASVRGVHGAHLVVRTEEAGGPVQMPDPETDQPRYTFTASVTLRGSVVA